MTATSAPRRDRHPGPLLYGHRGASGEHPENTMTAFARALEVGANALETDVHRTADGHVVIAHDPDGARMAGVNAAIRDITLAEVSAWDLGHGEHVPTLREVIEAFDVRLNVDLKPDDPEIVAPVLELIDELDAAERVLLSSFHPRILRAVRAAGYPGPTGMSTPEVRRLVLAPHWWLARAGVPGDRAQVPVKQGVTLGSRWFIDKCHALGVAVDFWTINDVDQARALLELGADGIMSDHPATMAHLFAGRDG